MVESAFTTTAVIGAVVILSQLVLLVFGFGDDADGGDGGHFDAGGDAGHLDVGGHAGDFGGGDGAGDDLGGDADHWTKADGDLGHPGAHWFYEMLSVRTIAAALLFFGLTGRASLASGLAHTPALLVALAAGAAGMYVLYWIMKQVYRLQQSGNEDIRNAVGLDAQVYLTIPPARHGAGKIQMQLQQRLVEYQAVCDDDVAIPTGEQCVVTDIVGPDTVCVARVEALVDAH